MKRNLTLNKVNISKHFLPTFNKPMSTKKEKLKNRKPLQRYK